MTLVHAETGEVVAPLQPEEARRLTDQIRAAVDVAWELVTDAYRQRAWAALGYSSWDDYCTREFGAARLRLPREERQEVVASLRESGLSIRAIAAATGDSKDTVARSLRAGVANETPAPEPVDAEVIPEPVSEPAPITGTDGKTYRRPEPAPVLTEEEQYERDRAAAVQRTCRHLVRFTDDWPYMAGLRNSPMRSDVLDALDPHTREQVLLIEKDHLR